MTPPVCHLTRIAPTPSGYLHLGNILSFAITLYLAENHQASVLLRIDDMDHQRAQQGYIDDIFDTLHFMDLPWQQGPRDPVSFRNHYSQRLRLPLYTAALQHLIDAGQVFACDCSRAAIAKASPDGSYPGTCRDRGIPLDQPGVNWRLRTDQDQEISIPQLAGGTIQALLPPAMKDFIIRKKDGDPAYQLTSVIDDQHFGVDLIVRGKDLWPSTIAQLYLSTLLDIPSFSHCHFFHHDLLMDPAGEKLSKSAGATSIQFLKNAGKSKEEIYHIIAGLLGSPEPAIGDIREPATGNSHQSATSPASYRQLARLALAAVPVVPPGIGRI